MIEVEGYKAFHGTMKINAIHIDFKTMTKEAAPFEVSGDFLYKPDTDCWYNKATSYPASICEVVKDETIF